jgi:AcrR family transcriptional regulator
VARPLSDDLRRRIVDTAGAAFYVNGFGAVGVDAIAESAGVSKMTLYRYFASKQDLIVGVLTTFNENSTSTYEALMAGLADPVDRLMAVFEWIAELANDPGCRGCAFQNSAAEFPELDEVIHRHALENKVATRQMYLEQATLMKAKNPAALADQLLLLTDGAWAAARMWGAGNPATQVAIAARVLIDAQRVATTTRAALTT